MKIVQGNCGHIKVQWDNHHNCLKCSSCSRLSTCSMCSTWSEETWILTNKRRMYATRKSLMTRKREQEEKTGCHFRSATPQSYTARGRPHQGGFYSDAECIQSVSPPVTGQPSSDQPVTGQPVTGQPVTGQPGTRQPGTRQFFTSQPGTGQPHRSPVTRHQGTSHSVITRHRH